MNKNTYTPKNETYVPRLGTVKGAIFIVVVALALGIGLALASPAYGAVLREDPKGDISGTVTVNGLGTAGIAVELRQRTNGGGDASLATATTDATGTYHFASQASAANDAFYYVRMSGGKGTLSAWYSFPIIYVSGSEITVPGVELADVELVAPGQNVALPLPGSVSWKARKMGETYRLFVYAAGKNDKPVLDSGSLGTGTEFAIPEGGLPAGKYEAVVQVRDVVAGYGQSQSRFRFTVGAQAQGEVTTAPAQNNPANPPSSSQDSQNQQDAEGTTSAPSQGSNNAKPDLKVNLSADKTSVGAGDSIIYKVEVENAGTGQASGVVVTDKLPAGVSVDKAKIKATAGQVSLDSGTVTVTIGDLAPGSKTSIEIPISVSTGTGSNLSNQASATYNGATDVVQSNAYIAQVAAPLAGPPESQPQQPAQQPAQQQAAPPSGAANPPAVQPQNPVAAPESEAASDTQNNTQAKPAAPAAKKAAAPMPQTGGAFPIVLATILVLIMLAARYLRGR